MSFWDKMKDFVGIEDDYYDEDEFTDEELSNLDNYDTEKIDESLSSYNYDSKSQTEDLPLRSDDTSSPSINRYSEDRNTRKKYGVKGNMKVTIREPLTYEDGREVMDDILNGKTVVLNLEMLEMDKKTQVFYFVSGGVYSLNGSIQNVTKDIYVLVPEGVEIDGKLKETIQDKSLYQI